jgi:anti-anti-sigma factor
VEKALAEALAGNERRVVIDLHEIPFADSRGLEFLLDARDRVMAVGGSLKLANPNPILNEVLVATRLDRQLEIHFELEKAGGSFL